MHELPPKTTPYKIAISRAELSILVEHRAATGEPLQSFVRRLIREYHAPPEEWDYTGYDPLYATDLAQAQPPYEMLM